MLIWFVLFFIAAQILLEKQLLPVKMLQQRLLIHCLASIGFIICAIIIGIIIEQPVIIVGTATIFCGSIVSWSYRNKFEKVESGKSL